MSFQTMITEKLASITAMLNGISTNAKTIEELPASVEVDPLAKIHVSKEGESKSLKIEQLLNAISVATNKQLISVGSIVLTGQSIVFTDIVWKIAGIQYVKSQTLVIPYSASGNRREDIFVGDTSGNIVRIAGVQNPSITIPTQTPSNAVLITKSIITDVAVGGVTDPVFDTIRNISIQDGEGNEAFEVDDKILFENFTFDPATKKIINPSAKTKLSEFTNDGDGTAGSFFTSLAWIKNSLFGAFAEKATPLDNNDRLAIGDSNDSQKTKYKKWSDILITLRSMFQVKDTQIRIIANTELSEVHNGKTLIIDAAAVTLTVPATLSDSFGVLFIVKLGNTLTWATTAPHVFINDAPAPMVGTKTSFTGLMQKELATNNIYLAF